MQKPGNTLGLLGRLNQSSETLQTPARKTVECSNITSFNRRGPRRPRLISFSKQLYGWSISIPRALAGPDVRWFPKYRSCRRISLPRALAGPDLDANSYYWSLLTFQSPGPSQAPTLEKRIFANSGGFQSPGPSQAPTIWDSVKHTIEDISIPRALAGPDM